jgi:two-component system response regulator NreC
VHGHALLRQGLRRLLQDEPDFEVVSEAGNAAEALQRVFEHSPEVVIADANSLGMPASDIETVISQESPGSKVFFLTADDGVESTGRHVPSFGAGHAARHTSVTQFVEMVRSACRGTGPRVRQMPQKDEAGWQIAEGTTPRKRMLTAREREVLKLLAEGRTVRSAASVLGLSVKTVDAHKFNLMRKLGIHNKAELVMWAIQKKLVKIPANF